MPWARAVSANPLELDDPDLPPALSGYPVGDRSQWDAFRAEEHRVNHDLQAELSDFCAANGAGHLPRGKFQYDSPWLNVYLYPAEADYPRSRPLDPTWHRLDATIRKSDSPWDVGARLPGDGKVVYLSLGSLGCMDVGLMQRLIDVLDRTEHRVDRQHGAVARGAPPRRADGRRAVPAAGLDPAAVRPPDHARRQQHLLRVVRVRPADDRAPALLGPVRQRPACPGHGLRYPPRDLRVRGRRAPRRSRAAARATTRSARACGRSPSGSPARADRSRAPT